MSVNYNPLKYIGFYIAIQQSIKNQLVGTNRYIEQLHPHCLSAHA